MKYHPDWTSREFSDDLWRLFEEACKAGPRWLRRFYRRLFDERVEELWNQVDDDMFVQEELRNLGRENGNLRDKVDRLELKLAESERRLKECLDREDRRTDAALGGEDQ